MKTENDQPSVGHNAAIKSGMNHFEVEKKFTGFEKCEHASQLR